MAIKEGLLPEYDMEMAATRAVLERVPDDKLDWQPHEKSMTLGRLAVFLRLNDVPVPQTYGPTADEPDF